MRIGKVFLYLGLSALCSVAAVLYAEDAINELSKEMPESPVIPDRAESSTGRTECTGKTEWKGSV